MSLLLTFILSAFVSAATSFEGYYFVNDCIVQNLTGKIETILPGQSCYILEDGSFYSISETGVQRFDPDKNLKWRTEGHFHHQMALSEDKKRILLMGSSFKKVQNELMRDDQFQIVSGNDGKILHSVSFSELVPEKELLKNSLSDNWSIGHAPIRHELAHFNSFFEIPQVTERKGLPWLKAGNYVVNSLFLGVYVLSPDLKKVLHHFKYERSSDHQVHDVKVLPSGNLFLFNNVAKSKIPYSAVEEVDPETMKPVYVYGFESGNHFFSSHRGGTDIISDDLFIFTLQWQGAYIVSRKSGQVILSNNRANTHHGNFHPAQNVRFLNLKESLKKWQK